MGLSGLMALSIYSVRFISHSWPKPSLFLASTDCSQPCWQSIRPGFSTRAEFLQQAQFNYPYQVLANYKDDGQGGLVRDILLNMRGDIRLGDIILAFGVPSHAQLGWVAGRATTQQGGRRLYVGATLYFANGLVTAEVVREDCVWRFSPDMIVRRVRYSAPNSFGSVIPIGTPKWQGFVTQPPTTTNVVC
ncbi:MAG: hypothetical protein CUN55_13700 [Phototrophicales bacterium]|nr:MAG: hypothetical protein CUN55_13700 [Phototrophicales bacterium]